MAKCGFNIRDDHPTLLRQLELEALAALTKNANARIYIGFDKHFSADVAKVTD